MCFETGGQAVPEPEHRGASWCLYGMATVKSLRIDGVICVIAILMHSCDWSVPPPRLPIRDSRPHATVRVNVGFVAGKPIHVTQPKMPPNAKRAGIKPLVILEINIDEAGNVSVLRTVGGELPILPFAIGRKEHASSHQRHNWQMDVLTRNRRVEGCVIF